MIFDGRSYTTQLHFLDDVYKGLADGKKIETVYTDFGKVFDKVDHGLLLSKLLHIGVHGKVLKQSELFEGP